MTEHRDVSPTGNAVHTWDGADPLWQESVAVWFFDALAGVGGFFRFGIHPNQGVGRFNLFAFHEDGLRFRRVRTEVPAEPQPGAAIEVGTCRAGLTPDGAVQFGWAEPECGADLVMVEHFSPEHGFGGTVDDEVANSTIYAGHIEASGRLAGTVRLGDATHSVDALVHRDRSWGPRDMSVILTNRMISGTMGPELSFALNTIQLRDGTVMNLGSIARAGRYDVVNDFVILPSIHLDGYSVEAGTALVRMPDGERLVITCETIDGTLTPHDEYLTSDHISVARCGDLVGFCDNELTNNPRLGEAMPPFLQYVAAGDGLDLRPPRGYRLA